MFKEGDIVFQNKKSKEMDLLTFISGSKYNNVGILFCIKGKWYVLEAVQPVQLSPVSAWIKEGEESVYEVMRLKDLKELTTPDALEKMDSLRKEFMGKSLDSGFEWSDKNMYPAELVWKIYKRAFAIELSEPSALADFDLSAPGVRQLTEKTYGKKVPLYEDIITNNSIYNSSLLESVTIQ
jgi:hypothetical protein